MAPAQRALGLGARPDGRATLPAPALTLEDAAEMAFAAYTAPREFAKQYTKDGTMTTYLDT